MLAIASPTRDDTLKEKAFAARLYANLNRPRHAKYQDHLGTYGWRQRIGFRQFEYHLRGHDSIAVSAVDGERANFLAIDVDEGFERRLPIIADALKKRNLDKASFAINGSELGRGKVVVTLRDRLPQRQAVRLVQTIAAESTADRRFGKYSPKDLTLFPQMGDGGHVRLFGRNLRRVRARILTEAPLNLSGDLSDLYYVEPAEIAPEPVARSGNRTSLSTLSTWALHFTEEPYVGATADLFKAQARLAYEAVSLHGKTRAVPFLSEAFGRIEARSPDLSPSARRNLLRADTVARLVEYAAMSRPDDGNRISRIILWLPKSNVDASKPARRIYIALSDYVLVNGLDPNCFGMTFDRIADVTGYAGKGKAWEALCKAVKFGLIVRLDNGLPKQDGRQGLCGLYALVGNHNNPYQARAAGQATATYLARSNERLLRGLPPLPFDDTLLPTAA